MSRGILAFWGLEPIAALRDAHDRLHSQLVALTGGGVSFIVMFFPKIYGAWTSSHSSEYDRLLIMKIIFSVARSFRPMRRCHPNTLSYFIQVFNFHASNAPLFCSILPIFQFIWFCAASNTVMI